jgi:hypothetical protein
MAKSRQWVVLGSSVRVLRLRKCDKNQVLSKKKSWRALKNRDKVGIEIQIILLQNRKKLKFLNFF